MEQKRKVGRPPKAKAKAKSVKKSADSVTITGAVARRFNDAKLDLSESGRIPFEVSNPQFMEMLLNDYDKSSGSF